jgi:hypothetical protein
MHENK